MWSGLQISLGAAVLLATGCSSSPTPQTVGKSPAPVLMYTCCRAATTQHSYHPGDTVALHWMRSRGKQGRDIAPETLKARLDGPYAHIAQAKAGTFGAVQATSKPIKVSPGDATPISDIRIPAYAKPGLYAVTTTDVEGGGSEWSKTIISVVGKAH